MLVFLSSITFQLITFNYGLKENYFPDSDRTRAALYCLKTVLFILAFVAILVNLAPVVFVSWTWIEPQVVVFNVSYLFNVEKIVNSTNDEIPPIALRDMTNEQAHSLSDIKVVDNLSKFEVFSKLVILFLTLSSFL